MRVERLTSEGRSNRGRDVLRGAVEVVRERHRPDIADALREPEPRLVAFTDLLQHLLRDTGFDVAQRLDVAVEHPLANPDGLVTRPLGDQREPASEEDGVPDALLVQNQDRTVGRLAIPLRHPVETILARAAVERPCLMLAPALAPLLRLDGEPQVTLGRERLGLKHRHPERLAIGAERLVGATADGIGLAQSNLRGVVLHSGRVERVGGLRGGESRHLRPAYGLLEPPDPLQSGGTEVRGRARQLAPRLQPRIGDVHDGLPLRGIVGGGDDFDNLGVIERGRCLVAHSQLQRVDCRLMGGMPSTAVKDSSCTRSISCGTQVNVPPVSATTQWCLCWLGSAE